MNRGAEFRLSQYSSLDTRFSRALLFQRLQQVLGAGFEPRVEKELRSSELPFARQVLDV